jgi:hypothetical protein
MTGLFTCCQSLTALAYSLTIHTSFCTKYQASSLFGLLLIAVNQEKMLLRLFFVLGQHRRRQSC